MFAHPGGSGIRGSPYHHPYFADESRSSPALRRLGNPPAEEEAEIVERLGHGPGHLGVGEVAESLVAEQAAQRCGEPAVEVGHAEDGDPQAPVLVDEEESVRVRDVEALRFVCPPVSVRWLSLRGLEEARRARRARARARRAGATTTRPARAPGRGQPD